ncbi:MAG TPA: J domain-containing protein [Microlunatus sp.]|nr:J domain-containing protein [Microlunatus sp.]
MTDPRHDVYAVLGLRRDASPDEVNAAFRSLVRRLHPDTRAPGTGSENVDADAALQEVVAAYATLRDPARRSAYDEQTAPLSGPTGNRAHSIRVAVMHSREDLPIRAGPVHWIPPE